MTNEMQVYKELEQQLKEAHQISTALWVGEIDTIVTKLNVSLLCSKDLSDFLLQE